MGDRYKRNTRQDCNSRQGPGTVWHGREDPGAKSGNGNNGRKIPDRNSRKSTSSSHSSDRMKGHGFRSTRNGSRSDSERGRRLPKRRRRHKRHGSSSSDSSRQMQRSKRRR